MAEVRKIHTLVPSFRNPEDYPKSQTPPSPPLPTETKRNVEIKASVSDPAAVLKRASELCDRTYAYKNGLKIGQKDTFFNSANGRLKLRRLETAVIEPIRYVVQIDAHSGLMRATL